MSNRFKLRYPTLKGTTIEIIKDNKIHSLVIGTIYLLKFLKINKIKYVIRAHQDNCRNTVVLLNEKQRKIVKKFIPNSPLAIFGLTFQS